MLNDAVMRTNNARRRTTTTGLQTAAVIAHDDQAAEPSCYRGCSSRVCDIVTFGDQAVIFNETANTRRGGSVP
jgi:hypothetical protein